MRDCPKGGVPAVVFSILLTTTLSHQDRLSECLQPMTILYGTCNRSPRNRETRNLSDQISFILFNDHLNLSLFSDVTNIRSDRIPAFNNAVLEVGVIADMDVVEDD